MTWLWAALEPTGYREGRDIGKTEGTPEPKKRTHRVDTGDMFQQLFSFFQAIIAVSAVSLSKLLQIDREKAREFDRETFGDTPAAQIILQQRKASINYEKLILDRLWILFDQKASESVA